MPQLWLFLQTDVDGTLMWRYNIKLLQASPSQIKALKLCSFALDNGNSNLSKTKRDNANSTLLNQFFYFRPWQTQTTSVEDSMTGTTN